MSSTSNQGTSHSAGRYADGGHRSREREIDASARLGVLGAIKASVFWMLVSAILGLIASIKLHSPTYLSEYSALTYGKVYPAFWNALVFGWLLNGGFACVAWIVARLAGRPSAHRYLLPVAVGAWNLAVAIGLFGIFWGDQTPYRFLEFPTYAGTFVLVSFIAVGVWIVLAFRARAFRSSFASQWYALAGVFSFAWIYTVAQTMVVWTPSRGVFPNVVAAWFGGNLTLLVVTPLALATVYYLIPKALGQHIVGYRQSSLAFWSWMGFASCSGLATLVNGPFPAWVASVGVIASFALFLPIAIFGMQFLSSLLASFSRIWDTISVRYVFYGVISFLVASLLIVFGSLREVQETVQFSQFDNGVRFLLLAGFAGMVFTGGTYFILPRVLHKELPSASLADFQFWIQGLGIFAFAGSMIGGGVAFGSLLNGSTADTVTILTTVKPYFYIATLGAFIFLCASLAFAISFVWMLAAPRSAKEKSADFIKPAPELEYRAS